jgi:hypothetical protein
MQSSDLVGEIVPLSCKRCDFLPPDARSSSHEALKTLLKHSHFPILFQTPALAPLWKVTRIA